MKILNPDDNPTHLISVIPETYPESKAILTILHELSGASVTETLNITQVNGYIEMTTEEVTVKEGASYELTILNFDTEKVIWRGKAYATAAADLQNYKLTQ